MDAQTLRQKNADALQHDLKDAKAQLKSLQFKLSSNQVKNVRELRALKKNIARMNTIVSEIQKNS